jgi:hypothetical protein
VDKYVGYDDYDALYPMKLTEDQFNDYLPSAEAYIDLITHDRARSATGYKAERVKRAVCAVIGEMVAQDACKSANGARLQSVSNDGYTETYRTTSAGTAEEAYAIRQTAMRWLSGTGLVSAL